MSDETDADKAIKAWLPSLLTDLHRKRLKSLGFRKLNRTFSRDKGSYGERFNFQGSTSNYRGVVDWRFFINVGVEFKDLEPLRLWSYMVNTHWATRIRDIVPRAGDLWYYNLTTDRNALVEELAELIATASPLLAGRVAKIRQDYLQRNSKG